MGWGRSVGGGGAGREVRSGGVSNREGTSARARLLGQVGTDMDEVVRDHAESGPAPDAVRSFVERSPQSMPAIKNADAAFAAFAANPLFRNPLSAAANGRSWR